LTSRPISAPNDKTMSENRRLFPARRQDTVKKWVAGWHCFCVILKS
jgi:hypothetical protein